MLTKKNCKVLAEAVVKKYKRKNERPGWERADIIRVVKGLNGTEDDMCRITAFATEMVVGEYKS